MKRAYILPLFLVIQILFLKVLRFFPEWVETNYSQGLYPYIGKTLRILFGWVPFSIGDIVYSLVILWLFYFLIKKRKLLRIQWKSIGLQFLSVLSVVYFVFHLLWGFNYYRLPLFEKMDIERDYSQEQLVAFTEKLVGTTNQLQEKITHSKNKKVVIPYSQTEIFEKGIESYQTLSKTYPYFTFDQKSSKKSLLSIPLTYMGFGGYLNPFTNEAQVNSKIPMYGFPNVVCHEMAHQIGFGSESECNFIGFLACLKSGDDYFKYSASTTALRYCLYNLSLQDEAQTKTLLKKINPGVIANFKESELFWQQYDTFIDTAFHAFYDQYLKANQQEDGIDSYSKYINLLVNYDKNNNLW